MKLARTLLRISLIACLLLITIPATPAMAATGNISIYPLSGSPATVVNVTGTGFTPGSRFTIYLGAAPMVTGTIDATGSLGTTGFNVPVYPRGVYPVTVTTNAVPPDNSTSVNFTIVPALTLDTASGAVGDTIKISGSGFAANATITFNFDSIALGTAASDPSGAFTAILITIPPTSPGRHNITGNDGLIYSPAVIFMVVPKLIVVPNVQTVGSQVTLSGSGFSAYSPIIFYIDGSSISSSGSFQTDINGSFSNVTLTIPPLSQGTHVLQAQDAYNTSTTANLFIRPNITLNPETGGPGTIVQVTGNGFAANRTITITYYGVAITTAPAIINSDANGSFTANFTVPPGTTGSYLVQASDTINSASASFGVAATGSLNPASGPVGASLTVSGSNFKSGATITISYDGAPVATATADSSGAFSATFKAPNSASGNHRVTATDNVNVVNLTFTIAASASLTPSSGYVDSNVTVVGAGFAASKPAIIRYDNIQVATGATDATGAFNITFKAPNSPTGSHQVTATDAVNTATLSFSILPSATITPASGHPGSNITVKGTGFAPGRLVTIRYDNIQIATAMPDANGAFSTTFTAPPSVTGSHQVVATDTVNTATLGFTVSPNASLNPTTGYVGSNIAVAGAGFTAGKTITIRYDNTQLAQATTDATGTFATTIIAPASKGGSHQVSITDGTNTVTADFVMDSAPPPAPVLLQPAEAAKADALATFSWTPVTDPSGVTYTLQIASDNTSFSKIVLEKKGLTSPGYTLTDEEKLKSVSQQTPYFWRVRAIDNAANEGPWSAPRSFYVGFVLPTWGLYTIFGVVVLLALILGFWLGRKMSYY